MEFLVQPQSVTNGTNSLGAPTGNQDIVLGYVKADWDDAADTALVEDSMRRIYNQHVDILKQEDAFINWQFPNYADITQDPIKNYGETNVAALQEASRKYDPNGLFQKQVPGGHKLF